MDKAAFVKFLQTTNFKWSTDMGGETEKDVLDFTDNKGVEHLKNVVEAYVWKNVEATLPDGNPFSVSYQEAIEWVGTLGARHGDYEVTPAIEDVVLLEFSAIVLDENGDQIDWQEIDRMLKEHIPNFVKIDYDSLIPKLSSPPYRCELVTSDSAQPNLF